MCNTMKAEALRSNPVNRHGFLGGAIL
jgi:hypothetical protein